MKETSNLDQDSMDAHGLACLWAREVIFSMILVNNINFLLLFQVDFLVVYTLSERIQSNWQSTFLTSANTSKHTHTEDRRGRRKAKESEFLCFVFLG